MKPLFSFIVATLTPACEILRDINKLRSSVHAEDFEVILAREVGKARCRNLGFQKSVGRFVIFFDGDISISSKIIIWIMEWVRSHPNEVLCYPHPSTRGFVSSKVLAISRENFLREGFDDSFEDAMDEEWGLRSKKAGMPQHYMPREWVIDIGVQRRESSFIEVVRRPFQRGKRRGYHPKLTFVYEDQRNPLRTLYRIIQQGKPVREHFGVFNVRHAIIFLAGLVYGLVCGRRCG